MYSYSLYPHSTDATAIQMPNFWSVLDRISKLLKPETGLISVADFYTSGRSMDTTPEIAGVGRECSWLLRWFWQIWFEFDGVHLGPQRREYLEHRFSTVSDLLWCA